MTYLFLTITWINRSPQLEILLFFYQNNSFHLASCSKNCCTVLRNLSSKEVCWHTSAVQLHFLSLLTADTACLVLCMAVSPVRRLLTLLNYSRSLFFFFFLIFPDVLLCNTTVKIRLFHRNVQAIVIPIHQKEDTSVSLNFQKPDKHCKYYSEISMQLNYFLKVICKSIISRALLIQISTLHP